MSEHQYQITQYYENNNKTVACWKPFKDDVKTALFKDPVRPAQ
jgi:hypothetical protein